MRVGRILKDGSRRGSRVVRPLSIYLSPARAEALEIEAIRRRMARGDIIDLALANLGIGVEPLTNAGHTGKRAATTRQRAAKKKPAKKAAKKKRAAA